VTCKRSANKRESSRASVNYDLKGLGSRAAIVSLPQDNRLCIGERLALKVTAETGLMEQVYGTKYECK